MGPQMQVIRSEIYPQLSIAANHLQNKVFDELSSFE